MAEVGLSRVILFVHDVPRVAKFYQDVFGFAPIGASDEGWVVLRTGAAELALHRIGDAYRDRPLGTGIETNAKLVYCVDHDLADYRAGLISKGVILGEIQSFPSEPRPLCDGIDPEGNVFQIMQVSQ